ncbi:MAG: class I SAM-dependent methyltransferase [Verrucomicrobium sp.]
MSRTQDRGKFEGVIKVVSFNRTFYMAGVISAFMAGAVLVYLPMVPHLRLLGWLLWSLGVWWLVGSLVVTHWIYDKSPLFHWAWLGALLPKNQPASGCFVHAGFDEASGSLKEHLGRMDWQVLDFYDENLLGEPSINLARKLYPPPASQQWIRYDHWPLPSTSVDVVFFFFAAHELRMPEQRVALLREATRVLAPDGRCIIVEHVRDLANALVYGPGVFHFHSVDTWLADFETAGLKIASEGRITPWVRTWALVKS